MYFTKKSPSEMLGVTLEGILVFSLHSCLSGYAADKKIIAKHHHHFFIRDVTCLADHRAD